MQSLGRYQIIEQIGAGAMGAVYKARDPMMDRDVAIKTILTQAIEGPQSIEFRERFFREAQAAGRLAHPGIVTVYDVSEHEGAPFLVMEYVAGRTLQAILQGHERMDMDRVFELGIQLAEALDYAHRNGVIHRDIKPANILIARDGRAKIADFGIARLADSQVTSTGQLLGTPAFMAPEQFVGAHIDGRADLFAAGVVLYWMATGDKPFAGDSILAVQYKVVHTDPVPPRRLNPAISRELEAVILKSVAKDPAERYQFGAELARDLRALRLGRTAPLDNLVTVSDDSEATLVTDSLRLLPSGEGTRTARPPAAHLSTRAPARKERRTASRLLAVTIAGGALLLGAVGIVKKVKENPAAPQSIAVAPTIAQTALTGNNIVANVPAAAAAPASSRSGPERPKTEEPQGVQESRTDVPAAESLTSDGKAAGIVPSGSESDAAAKTGDATSGPGNRSFVGSPARQRELAQSQDSVRLLIKCPAVAEFLTVIVRVDNGFFFRHEATASLPDGIVSARQGQMNGLPMIPLAEERLLPPGGHKLQVSVLSGTTRMGRVQELTAQFGPGERHTLLIQFVRDTPRAGGRPAGGFSVTLE